MNRSARCFIRIMCLIACLVMLTGCIRFPDPKPDVPVPSSEGHGGSTKPDVPEKSTDVSSFDGRQVTEKDIDAINDEQVLYIYDEEGFLTTIVGRFYDRPVKDFDDAINAFNPLRGMMGLVKEIQPFAVYESKDQDGYHYYTYQQRYGNQTLWGATLKIVTDRDGWTVAMSSSFRNVSQPETVRKIDEKQALQIAMDSYEGADKLTFYPEQTHELAIAFDSRYFNCFVVYSDNDRPDILEQQYLGHFVSFDGEYVTNMPMQDFESDSYDQYETDSAFDVLEQHYVKYDLTYPNGKKYQVDMPVCYNPVNRMYILADKERKMMLADYSDWKYRDTLSPVMSSSPTDWKADHILVYYNYMRAYDFYRDNFNLNGPDGFGLPVLITVDWKDRNGRPVNNACYWGDKNGWACFGVSTANNWCQALDVVGHEYTHAVFQHQMQGSVYTNESGAINESMADIMGNIIEMSYDHTFDTSWSICEASGYEMRTMSDPRRHEQPARVGDKYYIAPVGYPSSSNDTGGVHTNSSLTNYVAYYMHEEGCDLPTLAQIWYIAAEIMTPYSDYDDLYACLRYGCRVRGREDMEDAVTDGYVMTGMAGDRMTKAREYVEPGYGRVYFYVPEDTIGTNIQIELYDTVGNNVNDLIGIYYPAKNGLCTFQVEKNRKFCFALVQFNSNDTLILYYSSDGQWTKSNSNWGIFTLQEGSVNKIPDPS